MKKKNLEQISLSSKINLQNLPSDVLIRKLQAQYQGPIPSSGEFIGYEQVPPGSGSRILVMAEDANKATIWIKKGELILKFSGLFFGYLITISGIPWTYVHSFFIRSPLFG